MTTAISISTDDLLKRKIGVLTGDELSQGGPNQKILKRTPSELSDISLDEQFTFPFEEYEDDEEEDMNEDDDTSVNEDGNGDKTDLTPNQKTEEKPPQQPAPTQRKKPGRKPNPASPALRKAQNRAAQRAFRERKERHLKDLENTIQSLRADQIETINKFHREREHLRSLVEQFEAENSYLKCIAFNFECALNSISGGNEAVVKIKNSALSSISHSSFTIPLSGGNIGNFDSSLSMVPTTVTIGLNGSQPPTHQQQLQLQVPTLNLNSVGAPAAPFTLPSPANSSIILSPKPANMSSPTSAISSPPTPADSVRPDSNRSYFADLVNPNIKSFIDTNNATNTNAQIDYNPIYQKLLLKSFEQNPAPSQLVSKQTSANDNGNEALISVSPLIRDPCDLLDSNSNEISTFNTALILSGDAESIGEGLKDNNASYSDFDVAPSILGQQYSKEAYQLIRLAKLVGCTDPSVPVKPMVRNPLTAKQQSFLSIPHDPRIDLIPCLHLRSRMIQYQGHYDLYELCELLINKAKCHGNPMDPDSWECPEEFFTNYPYLAFQHCRLKSAFYQKFGELPADFNNLYKQYYEKNACI